MPLFRLKEYFLLTCCLLLSIQRGASAQTRTVLDDPTIPSKFGWSKISEHERRFNVDERGRKHEVRGRGGSGSLAISPKAITKKTLVLNEKGKSQVVWEESQTPPPGYVKKQVIEKTVKLNRDGSPRVESGASFERSGGGRTGSGGGGSAGLYRAGSGLYGVRNGLHGAGHGIHGAGHGGYGPGYAPAGVPPFAYHGGPPLPVPGTGFIANGPHFHDPEPGAHVALGAWPIGTGSGRRSYGSVVRDRGSAGHGSRGTAVRREGSYVNRGESGHVIENVNSRGGPNVGGGRWASSRGLHRDSIGGGARGVTRSRELARGNGGGITVQTERHNGNLAGGSAERSIYSRRGLGNAGNNAAFGRRDMSATNTLIRNRGFGNSGAGTISRNRGFGNGGNSLTRRIGSNRGLGRGGNSASRFLTSNRGLGNGNLLGGSGSAVTSSNRRFGTGRNGAGSTLVTGNGGPGSASYREFATSSGGAVGNVGTSNGGPGGASYREITTITDGAVGNGGFVSDNGGSSESFSEWTSGPTTSISSQSTRRVEQRFPIFEQFLGKELNPRNFIGGFPG